MTTMTTNPVHFDGQHGTGLAPRRDPARLLYSGMAITLLILALIGFAQFYFHGKAYPGRELTPPIRTLIISHGLGMLLWMVIFTMQPLLVIAGRRDLHRMLGRVGVIVALYTIIVGWGLAIESTRVNPPDLMIWGLNTKQFLTVPVFGISLFMIFVAIGIWQRKRREIHRPMMLLATLAAMPAAVGRIDALSAWYRGTAWEFWFGPTLVTLAIGGLFLLVSRTLNGRWDAWFAVGYAGLFATSLSMMQLARTHAWDEIATMLLR